MALTLYGRTCAVYPYANSFSWLHYLSPARLLYLPRLRSMQTEAGIYWPAHHCFFSSLQAFYFSFKAALAFTGLGSVVGRGGPLPSTISAAGIAVSATCIREPHGVSAASSGLPSICFTRHLGVSRVAKPCFLFPKAVYSWPSCGAGRLMLSTALLSGGAAHTCTCDVRSVHFIVGQDKGGLGKSEQLFMSWAKPHGGKPVTKQKALPLDCGSDR